MTFETFDQSDVERKDKKREKRGLSKRKEDLEAKSECLKSEDTRTGPKIINVCTPQSQKKSLIL